MVYQYIVFIAKYALEESVLDREFHMFLSNLMLIIDIKKIAILLIPIKQYSTSLCMIL